MYSNTKIKRIRHGKYTVMKLPYTTEPPFARQQKVFRHPDSLRSCNNRLWELVDLSSMVCSNNLQQMSKYIHITFELKAVLRQIQNEPDICRRRKYRAFPIT